MLQTLDHLLELQRARCCRRQLDRERIPSSRVHSRHAWIVGLEVPTGYGCRPVDEQSAGFRAGVQVKRSDDVHVLTSETEHLTTRRHH